MRRLSSVPGPALPPRPLAPAPLLAPVRLLAPVAVVLALLAGPARARTLLTGDEALRLAFPGCKVERTTRFLTAEEKARVERLAGTPLESAIVHPYVAACDGAPAGAAWFDVHRVRTLPEVLMIVVDPSGRVRRVEVLSFSEPADYLPRSAWYAQFEGRALGPELGLEAAIRPVAGATLTARATTGAVRRALALHQVVFGRDAPPSAEEPEPAKAHEAKEPARSGEEPEPAKPDAAKEPAP